MEKKQASIYLRVIWLDDNENLRPSSLNIKLDGETTENVVFSISKENKNIGINAPWKTNDWANGVTYNYQKEQQEVNELTDEEQIISNIPYVIPSIVDDITLQNYRKNIIKDAETEEYAYYTIKMTYVPPKRKLMARSTTPALNFNGTAIENANFNDVELDKVYFNNALVFEKKRASFSDIILANSTLNEGTPNFALTATTDEGMFRAEDTDGTSYYFRGAVTNNYVKFAGFCWRIVRINGDGSMRLIYDGSSCHANGTSTAESIAVASTAYNTSDNQSNYVGWTYTGTSQRTLSGTASNAKTQLESWYNSNIGNNATYSAKVVDGKFCNDRNVGQPLSNWTGNWSTIWDIKGTRFAYAGAKRLYEDYAPTLSCDSGDTYTLKVGLITADEVEFAGGKNTNNASYYLYDGQFYWTMSPYSWNGTYANVFFMFTNGSISNASNDNAVIGLRPVINLKSAVQVTGTGTMEDPYVVVGAE